FSCGRRPGPALKRWGPECWPVDRTRIERSSGQHDFAGRVLLRPKAGKQGQEPRFPYQWIVERDIKGCFVARMERLLRPRLASREADARPLDALGAAQAEAMNSLGTAPPD